MTNNWKEIWNKRQPPSFLDITLESLIRLDGFDLGAGFVRVDDWLENSLGVTNLLEISDGESVFEVGCGCGAFLKGLAHFRSINVSGIDYSEPLIDVAKHVFPDGEFSCIEANNMTGSKDADYVLAHGVFHYFDKDYARTVILKMIEKARKRICILDIPDEDKMLELEALRRGQLGEADYIEKYKDLNHTYYNKSWFLNMASELNVKVSIVEGMMPNYAQKDFRFGVLIEPKN